MTAWIANDKCERFTHPAMNLHRYGALEFGLIAFVTPAKLAFQLGIARLPQLVAGVDAAEINIPVSKLEQNRAAT
jgi:hypothetical protein